MQFNYTFVILGLVILLLCVLFFLEIQNTPLQERACTMEAMLCPDGSYVGRTGPQCTFAPCPTL